MKVLVDDFVKRNYFGVILTGGEPTLHPELPKIAAYASEQGLHVRMITNGTRLADPEFARAVAEAGVKIAHISVYSIRPEVEEVLRGTPGTLEKAYAAVRNAHEYGIEININCVINKLNADHLHENIDYWIEHHPYIRHFVWNNLDPSMGRAEVNQAKFTPRLAEFEVSLQKALRRLYATGRTFRVEKVPLCYMTEFAWASTETRKIVKGEERIVHFLDKKQTVRQTDWEHIYSDTCEQCALRPICGGLFDRGNAYDPAELYPVFVSMDAIVEKIITDPSDPSYPLRRISDWKRDFEIRLREAKSTTRAKSHADGDALEDMQPQDVLSVGIVTEQGVRKFEAKRRAEARKAEALGVEMERTDEIGKDSAPGPNNCD
jgi:MoaA/NifB/PqqE/SkfB family radical SAM enzyme